MFSAECKEIRAFLTTLDPETPRTVNAIIAELRNHYRHFWFEEERVRKVLERYNAASFTLGNGLEYFYFEGEGLEQLLGKNVQSIPRILERAEHYRPKAA